MVRKKTELLCAYLINGEDHLKRDRALSRMRMRLEKLGDLAFNSDTFSGTAPKEGNASRGQQVVDACKTLPFASEKRLVVVMEADKLNKESQNLISQYLENPNPSTVLLLISDKLPKNSRLYKAVSNGGPDSVIDCTPVKAKELVSLVRDMALSHGIALTQGAANALTELIGDNTLHLDAELEKLALRYAGQNEVTEKDVRDMVARVQEPKPWHFVDAFSNRDIPVVIDMLSRYSNPDSSHALLRQCVTRVRELICAKCMTESNSFSLPALAQALGKKDWQLRGYQRFASRFTMEELESALASSLDCEREMKSGAKPDAAFTIWLLEVMSR